MDNEDKKLYNNATVEEAITVLKENKIKLLNGTVAFYKQHVDEIDEEPDQLIGIETEESQVQAMIDEMNERYLIVVEVADDVTTVKAGDYFLMTQNMLHSLQDFPASGLKFGMVPERMITVIKEA
jgi:hypothetical protein